MGIVETLVLGAYGWGFWVWRNLSKKITQLTSNHLATQEEAIKNLHERVTRLENP